MGSVFKVNLVIFIESAAFPETLLSGRKLNEIVFNVMCSNGEISDIYSSNTDFLAVTTVLLEGRVFHLILGSK